MILVLVFFVWLAPLNLSAILIKTAMSHLDFRAKISRVITGPRDGIETESSYFDGTGGNGTWSPPLREL